MRTYPDAFGGATIYPGKGKLFIRGDSKIFRFQNGKSESLFHQRKNPRRISWTILYRKKNKKGAAEEVTKRKTRKTVKNQRAIIGASLDLLKDRASVASKNATRAKSTAQRADAKEKRDKAKKAAGSKNIRIQSKQGSKGAQVKVMANSR